MDVRQTVLLVEDDAALSKMVSGLIAEAGYQPITIGDHAQIAPAVERWKPRCVILDGAVPTTGEGRSWNDAIAIRRANPTIPVLLFSADAAAVAEANAGTSRRSRAAGFVGVVAKPFLIEEFLGKLRQAMPSATRPESQDEAAEPVTDDAISVLPDLTGTLAIDAGRTDFVSAAVHELRAPLTVMRGQVQLALRHIGNDRGRGERALELALGQVDRMTRMIDSVIEHSKLASNSLILEITRFDVAEVALEAVARRQHAEPPRIMFNAPVGAHLRVRADRSCVVQILDNLLDNAFKYSAVDSQVDVTLALVDREVQVRVQDRGVGVPDEELRMLFTPYYRTSLTRSVHGTGLGLHISRQFAERCGGKLVLESSSSGGSVFRLTLPLTD